MNQKKRLPLSEIGGVRKLKLVVDQRCKKTFLHYWFYAHTTSMIHKAFPPIPTSPTLCLRAKISKSDGVEQLTTSLFPEPSTPPRTTHQISSMRTPLSSKGLKMSPSPSLAHYKSNLDPPPT